MNGADGDRLGGEPGMQLSEEERHLLRRASHREWQAAATVLCALALLVLGIASGVHPTTAVQRALLGAALATVPIRGLIATGSWLHASRRLANGEAP